MITLLLTSASVRLSGQARGGATQDQRPGPPGTIRVRVRLIPVDVVVTNQQDRPVTDLRQEELRIFEDGRPMKVPSQLVKVVIHDAVHDRAGTMLLKVK